MTISSYLQGGLGNQMFQYAIAKSLSKHYQIDFALDCSWFKNLETGVTPRKLELPQLQIDQDLFRENAQLTNFKKISIAFQYFLPFGPIIRKQKNAYDFDEDLYKLRNLKRRDLNLYGYWQSYKYFRSIRALLQNDFEPRILEAPQYKKYLDEICSSESVMLHIRRGDYVHSPSAAAFHGALNLEYYLAAMRKILENKKNANFFVFSDDLSWAKDALPKNLSITYVDANENDRSTPHELRLMTFCKHHIIANSSLSWWGAWLKKSDSGLTYTPNRWISDASLDLNNLLPREWIRLPA